MLIPPQVFAARITKHADESNSRFALGGVQVTRKNKKPNLVVTDSHVLLHLTWSEQKASEYPAIEGINPSGLKGKNGFEAIIPSKKWNEAGKLPVKKSPKPILTYLALDEIKKGKQEKVTMGATDLESDRIISTRTLDGRFPKVADQIPDRTEKEEVRIRINAFLLSQLLQTLVEFTGDDEKNPVTLCIPFDKRAPIKITTKDGEVEAIGLIMPLSK